MGSAIKYPVPDRVKPSFVIFDIRALWRSDNSGCQCQRVKISSDNSKMLAVTITEKPRDATYHLKSF